MTRKKLIGIRIGNGMDKWFSEEAQKVGLSKSELIRTALLEYMNGITRNEWQKLKFFMGEINKLK